MGTILHQAFDAAGECAELFRNTPWHATSLGASENWPMELRTMVQVVLQARQPMGVIWGDERVLIYNDAAASLLHANHPAAFGKPIGTALEPHYYQRMEPYIAAAYRGISSIEPRSAIAGNADLSTSRSELSLSYTPIYCDGRIAGLFWCGNDWSARNALQKRSERERQFLKTFFESSLGAVALTEGPNHVITYANEEYVKLLGHRDLINCTAEQAIPELVPQGFITLLDEVLATGKPHIGKSVNVILQNTMDAHPEHKVVDFVYHPLFNDDGTCDRVFVQAIDITERHMLHRELAHRLKNQLAVVQSIVNLTLKSGKDLNDAVKVLTERIAVLARAQDVVISGNVDDRNIERVIREALAWQSDERIYIHGPQLTIGTRQALSLALIIHELLTNALKYGALSTPSGKVELHWRIEGHNMVKRFILNWTESGAPDVEPPAHKGVGTRLIQAGISGTRNGTTSLQFMPQGLRFTLSADLASLQKDY